jgi:WhiB family redox-sensing transcriptional regulator
MARANCRSHNAAEFFPSDTAGIVQAQSVCVGCAVRAECLDYALANRIEHGVWGGASERARQAHPA